MPARGTDIGATEDIAARLRYTRQALGVNQRLFATRANLRPNRYNQYESGARALTIDAAQRICDECGVTLDRLFRGDRSMVALHAAIEIAHGAAAARKFQPPSSFYISFLLTGSRFL